jgi:hypothetical protein
MRCRFCQRGDHVHCLEEDEAHSGGAIGTRGRPTRGRVC